MGEHPEDAVHRKAAEKHVSSVLIIGDYTTQHIEDYNNPIGESL